MYTCRTYNTTFSKKPEKRLRACLHDMATALVPNGVRRRRHPIGIKPIDKWCHRYVNAPIPINVTYFLPTTADPREGESNYGHTSSQEPIRGRHGRQAWWVICHVSCTLHPLLRNL